MNTILQTLYIGMTTGVNPRTQKRAGNSIWRMPTPSPSWKGPVWYQMSIEEYAKQQRELYAQSKGKVTQTEYDGDDSEEKTQDDEDEYEDDEYIYSILSDPSTNILDQPIFVNGTQSAVFADERTYED